MINREVVVLKEARNDIKQGKDFYNSIEDGVGEYFVNSILSDIESLQFYSGIHTKIFGLYQSRSKRFPFSIYYEITNDIVYVLAILDMRQNPTSIAERLNR
jgi:hypothetical protein